MTAATAVQARGLAFPPLCSGTSVTSLNIHVKKMPGKRWTRASHVRDRAGPGGEQRPGGLVRSRSAWTQPPRATAHLSASPVPSHRPMYLSLVFKNMGPEILPPAQKRSQLAPSSLERPCPSPPPPSAPAVTRTSPWVHRTLAVHVLGVPHPHMLGFAFEVRDQCAHRTSECVFLGTGSFLASKREQRTRWRKRALPSQEKSPKWQERLQQ